MKLKSVWLAGVATAALLGGVSIASVAAADPIPPAASYADLLEPVSDASARLVAHDVVREQSAHLELAQYWGRGYDNHHHHHHHGWQWYRNNGYYWNGGGWAAIPEAHHHHHNAWWYQRRGYYWNGWAWAMRPRYYDRHHHHHHHHWQW